MADLEGENLDVNQTLVEAADGSSSDPMIATSYLEDYLFKLRADLDAINTELASVQAATDPYTPTNVTPDRAYDADATTVAELADVLGTLIADLQAKGLIS